MAFFAADTLAAEPRTVTVRTAQLVYQPPPNRNVQYVNIPHKAVGSVIGPGGDALRGCERETGCYISIDQSMKSQGHCVALVSGASPFATEAAVAFIQNRVQVWE